MTTAVAVALYNGERFLEKQLLSLYHQTKQPDQVVLCDDGSSDSTAALVQRFIEEYQLQDRWQLHKNEKNLGYAGNFFHAMDLCHTELIFLCDQDDIWRPEKIEKMAAVMEKNPHIMLLSSKYGVIDGNDAPITGMMVPHSRDTFALKQVTMEQLLRSYQWPGMCMCVRKAYFTALRPRIDDYKIPHDVVLAACCTDEGTFWEYGYVGADHRRHTNNAGGEEHRLSKVLNLERKLWEVETYNEMLSRLIASGLPLSNGAKEMLRLRLGQSQHRRDALKQKSLPLLWKTYTGRGTGLLRWASALCDVWLVCFGKKQSDKGGK